MKQRLRSFFSPILSVFEKGNDLYAYKSFNRKILIFIGFVFSGLTALVLKYVPEGVGSSFLIPVFVFGLLALITLVVGILGNERAVSKIWGDC